MKIVGAKVILSRPGKNYATLKLFTDQGVYGLGDATLNGRELAVASYLQDHVAPMLIGHDAFAIEDVWQLLYRGAYWRRGPVTMTAIAAVDTALWDIKGKALNTPVWNLLGGRTRKGVLTYTHTSSRDPSQAVEYVQAKIEEGFRAVRVQCAVPGMGPIYGTPMAEGVDIYSIDLSLPILERDWAPEKYLRFVPQLFERLRRDLGFDVALLHDAHHRLSPSQAGWLGKRLEDHQLLWLEDPVQSDLQQSYRQVRAATTTPIAIGEIFSSLYDCDLLIREQLIDYVRATVLHAGGITGLRKIAAYAEPHMVKTGCHGAVDLSPITMAASLHFATATHNAAVQEYMGFASTATEVFKWDWSLQDGYLIAGETSGLGVDIDEEAASKYPYERGYLPVARSKDGSVGNW
jgi:mannonate dehydratase